MNKVLDLKRGPNRRRRFLSAGKMLAALFIFSLAQYYFSGSVTWITDSFRWVENSTRAMIADPVNTLGQAGYAIANVANDAIDRVKGKPVEVITLSEPATNVGQPVPEFPFHLVVKVVDGDTIHVRDHQGTYEIRLHGIDAPEHQQAYSIKARNKLDRLIAGAKVRVIKTDTDRYDRAVAKIYHGDTYINESMVREGYAWWYEHYTPYEFNLRSAQLEAQQARRGLWQDPNPIPPWEYRRR